MELTIDVFRGVTPAHFQRLASVYGHMIDRCYSTTDSSHSYYGGRGIQVCQLWRENRFQFYAWAISAGYRPGLTLDRVNNNGNYEPSNCRWITRCEQQGNTRRVKKSKFRGVFVDPRTDRWIARITHRKRTIYLGSFGDEEQAARAFDTAAKRLRGDAAVFNFPQA